MKARTPIEDPEAQPKKRLGGRSARIRDAVITATLELLLEGQEIPTVEAVATRAQVQKTTIYRRWGNIETLTLAAVEERVPYEIPIPDTGSLAEDLLQFNRNGIKHHLSTMGSILTGILARSTEEIRCAYWKQRFGQIGIIFERARSRGELREDVNDRLVIEMLVAPLFFRKLITGDAITPDLAEQMTELVLPSLLQA